MPHWRPVARGLRGFISSNGVIGFPEQDEGSLMINDNSTLFFLTLADTPCAAHSWSMKSDGFYGFFNLNLNILKYQYLLRICHLVCEIITIFAAEMEGTSVS